MKKICFQLHWLLGITAGMFLVVMGLSGALISFQEEIIDAIRPGAVHAASGHGVGVLPLAPDALLAALRASGEMRRIVRIELHAAPGRNPRIFFAPMAGESHGATGWANAYTGQLQQRVRGADFFAWVERLHIWLLLPTSIGQPVTGGLAACLLVLCLSGLYLRWPRRPWSVKAWLHLPLGRKGRPWLWTLHSVVGTWALLVYLVLAGTGMYWGLPPVRAAVDAWAGVPQRAAKPAPAVTLIQERQPGAIGPEDLSRPWQRFAATAGPWQFVQIRLPAKPGQDLQFNWYTAEAGHEMARHRLTVAADGSVRRDERFEQLPAARRALAAFYPLHIGSYFGLPGRILAMLASLVMPLFAVTGWMLYLDRRRKARSLAQAAAEHRDADGSAASVAIIHASQSGNAHRLALRTVHRLRAAGHAVDLLSAEQLSAQVLARYPCTLWVVSTFGEGDPPDEARGLLRALHTMALPSQRYAVLALGDRQYAQFCAFGLRLHAALEHSGATPLCAAVTMDGESAAAWQTWCSALAAHWAMSEADPAEEGAGSAFTDYRLQRRVHCNPGSLGAPLYRLELQPPAGEAVAWQAGALVEVLPHNAPETIARMLAAVHCTGHERVTCRGQRMRLREALATSLLPDPEEITADLEALLARLQPMAPRRYSIGSLPEERGIQLWVRQVVHDGDRIGLASAWLTQHLALGSTVQLRLLANPRFAPTLGPEQTAILIGNGSGYAGLRAQLMARIRQGHHANWLLFGERQRHADGWAEVETRAWQAAGQLLRADFAYSRDAGGARYVQDLVREHGEALRRAILQGAVVYVCGSRHGMAAGVEQALLQLLGREAFAQFSTSSRYLRDVY